MGSSDPLHGGKPCSSVSSSSSSTGAALVEDVSDGLKRSMHTAPKSRNMEIPVKVQKNRLEPAVPCVNMSEGVCFKQAQFHCIIEWSLPLLACSCPEFVAP
jgi:hypothetical protein